MNICLMNIVVLTISPFIDTWSVKCIHDILRNNTHFMSGVGISISGYSCSVKYETSVNTTFFRDCSYRTRAFFISRGRCCISGNVSFLFGDYADCQTLR